MNCGSSTVARWVIAVMLALAFTSGITAKGTTTQAAIIPLHGSAGTVLADPIKKVACFDARLLDAMLQAADRAGATIFIMEIDSSGGRLDQLEAMLEVLAKWRSNARIIAFVRQADGPAAILAFACEELIVHPTAAVHAPQFEENASDQLRIRAQLEASGVPSGLAAGITTGELWWNPSTNEFATRRIDRSWTRIIDERRFRLTAHQLVELDISAFADDSTNAAKRYSNKLVNISHQIRGLKDRRASTIRSHVITQQLAEKALIRLSQITTVKSDDSSLPQMRRALGPIRADLTRSKRTLEKALENPHSAVDLPQSVVTCQIDAIKGAMDAIPADLRDLKKTSVGDSLKRAADIALRNWRKCE